MTSGIDDETVVVVDFEYGERRRMTLREYLAGEETNQPFELDHGVVREPAAPTWEHQRVAGRVFICLERHATRYGYGRVIQSPIDVVLDRERALVVQPDVLFIASDRLNICTDRIWGSPDLVVEVLSIGTARHDSTIKVSWFQQYGVRECWLVDPVELQVNVVSFSETRRSCTAFGEDELIRSNVLPRLRLRVRALFT